MIDGYMAVNRRTLGSVHAHLPWGLCAVTEEFLALGRVAFGNTMRLPELLAGGHGGQGHAVGVRHQ